MIERSELIEIPVDNFGQFQQEVLPFRRLEFAPRAIEGAACCGNSAIDVLAISLGHGREHFTCGRIDAVECLCPRRPRPICRRSACAWACPPETDGGW